MAKKDEVFIPGCKPDETGKADLRCDKNKMKLVVDGKPFVPEDDVLIDLEDGGKRAIIKDDGGAPERVIEHLRGYLEENTIRR